MLKNKLIAPERERERGGKSYSEQVNIKDKSFGMIENRSEKLAIKAHNITIHDCNVQMFW